MILVALFVVASLQAPPPCTLRVKPSTLDWHVKVSSAQDGAVVCFQRGYYRGGRVELTHDVTLRGKRSRWGPDTSFGGARFTVGGNATVRFENLVFMSGRPAMVIRDARVIMKRVEFARNGTFSKRRSGRVRVGPGALLIEGGNVVIDQCWFRDNRGGKYGGAIRLLRGSLEMRNCGFVDNLAHSGGAISVVSAPLSCTGCSFHGNRAFTGPDISAFMTKDSEPIRLRNTVFGGPASVWPLHSEGRPIVMERVVLPKRVQVPKSQRYVLKDVVFEDVVFSGTTFFPTSRPPAANPAFLRKGERDIYGRPRPDGNAAEVGAAEYRASDRTPPAKKKRR